MSNEGEIDDEYEDSDLVQYRRIRGYPRLMRRTKKMILMRYDIYIGEIILHFEIEE